MVIKTLKNIRDTREAVDLIARIILEDGRFHGCKIATNGPNGANDESLLVIEKDESIIASLRIDNKLTDGRLSVVERDILAGEDKRIAVPIYNDDIIEMVYSKSDKEALSATTSVYVYKEYNDDDAYGEEVIKVFAKRTAAVAELKKNVEEHFGMPFDTIPDNPDIFDKMDDSFSEDYVSINSGRGVMFWIVEQKPLIAA